MDRVQITGGDDWTMPVGSRFPDALRVRAFTDEMPVPDAEVTFTVSGAASFAGAAGAAGATVTVKADEDGFAAVELIAGEEPGAVEVTATWGDDRAVFGLTVSDAERLMPAPLVEGAWEGALALGRMAQVTVVVPAMGTLTAGSVLQMVWEGDDDARCEVERTITVNGEGLYQAFYVVAAYAPLGDTKVSYRISGAEYGARTLALKVTE
ncbi:hypothetical protein [Streptomyces sp. CB01881]|uniref:hypothetical protein n=1 Tax=Streptomyces sp. CB01881 TaxID=2078691 RepID=UPI0011DFA012|nr:hypothetical protein [Streptomyces sp. CB01881]TYC71738.1 hypothetical protein EH183_29120 [Streptomyces sp. CB01881]